MSQDVQSSQTQKPEQEARTTPTTKKRSLFARIPPRVRTVLALVVIAIAVVLAFHGPSEGESDNATGDPAFVPTVGITNQVDALTVNKSIVVQGLHITVSQITEAAKFSDDRKRTGNYTVRVMMRTKNSTSQPIGIQYASYLKLVLPNGQQIEPKYISLLPSTLPNGTRDGYADFPLESQVPLSSLSLHFGGDATLTFTT